jgi:pimeloyl-ACP methyl ester carboxylesterase
MARQIFPPIFMGIVCLSLSACLVPLSIDQQADALGLRKFRLLGQGFEHLVYAKGQPCATGKLHVYLEGDGLAWLPGKRIALDPTPSHSCLLPLMALDPNPSVYLGRPCYHGLAQAPGCHPELWTQARYGEAIVASMVQALLHLTQGKGCRPVLIGYSGGGALAMLMAARLTQVVSGVVTLAGNLDLAAWTTLHSYTPLDGSLDPAKLPPLPETIFQIHLAGESDDNIPAFLIRKEASRQPGARFFMLPRHAHACPPKNLWPGILAAISGLEIRSAKTAPLVRLNR